MNATRSAGGPAGSGWALRCHRRGSAVGSSILAIPSSSKRRRTTGSAAESQTSSGGTVARSPPATDRLVVHAHAGANGRMAASTPMAAPALSTLRLLTFSISPPRTLATLGARTVATPDSRNKAQLVPIVTMSSKDRDVAAETPLSAGQLLDRLPPRPAPELDRVLDAVERCL